MADVHKPNGMSDRGSGWPKDENHGPTVKRVREGEHYPAGLRPQGVRPGDPYPTEPPADGQDEPAEEGRCNFELIIRGSCVDTPQSREAIRRAVERALASDRDSSSILVQEAKVELGAVVMRS
jgi:hypothetical protein